MVHERKEKKPAKLLICRCIRQMAFSGKFNVRQWWCGIQESEQHFPLSYNFHFEILQQMWIVQKLENCVVGIHLLRKKLDTYTLQLTIKYNNIFTSICKNIHFWNTLDVFNVNDISLKEKWNGPFRVYVCEYFWQLVQFLNGMLLERGYNVMFFFTLKRIFFRLGSFLCPCWRHIATLYLVAIVVVVVIIAFVTVTVATVNLLSSTNFPQTRSNQQQRRRKVSKQTDVFFYYKNASTKM